MGRYTTARSFDDRSTEVQAAPTDAEKEAASKKDILEVSNVVGSTAGAGSGDFHQYRFSRRKELFRLAQMDKDDKQKQELDEFETRKRERAEAAEAAHQKRVAKRQKKKAKKNAKKAGNAAGYKVRVRRQWESREPRCCDGKRLGEAASRLGSCRGGGGGDGGGGDEDGDDSEEEDAGPKIQGPALPAHIVDTSQVQVKQVQNITIVDDD